MKINIIFDKSYPLDGHLYTATAADFSGSEPLIYREPVRTEHSDLRLLNDPSFVGAVASTSHVYFFYRETAVEYMNCGKVSVSTHSSQILHSINDN